MLAIGAHSIRGESASSKRAFDEEEIPRVAIAVSANQVVIAVIGHWLG
jgi:hypothetical protein